ncbi:MAG: hypothetical protein Q8Q25_01405, partial [bacterium]|nr:hypothetical protein [bacterium]
LFFCVLTLLFFLLDICTFSFFERPLSYSILGFYGLQIFTANNKHLSIIGLAILLESFIYSGWFGLPILYLIPLTILGLNGRKNLYTNRFLALLAGILAILTQCLLIEVLFLKNFPLNYYTLVKITGNIIMISILSLTIKPR